MTEIEKMELTSMNITEDKLNKLRDIFPEVFVEKGIDFDKLRAVLGDEVETGRERYGLSWAGKAECMKAIQQPSIASLKPYREESVDFDNTENLFIEGDNLEVLKLLQKSYYGKVKMVYIDPPYNTGNDFVYPDDYSDSLQNYLQLTGQVDSGGRRISTNTDTDGRFHSKWLNMMYPRLYLARNLLRDDGVIFVSIDDNEVANLKKVMDEIFGEENFINIITVKTKIGGVSGSSEGKSLKDATEFIYAFAKNKFELLLNYVYIRTPLFNRINSYVAEGKSWKYISVMTKLEDKILLKNDTTRGIKYWGYRVLETKSITAYAKELGISEQDVYSRYADRIFRTTNAQSSMRQTVIQETQGFDYPMYGCEYTPIKGKNLGQTIEVLYKSGATDDQRNMMMFLSDVVENIDGIYYYIDKVSSLWDDIEYNNLTKEGEIEFLNGKKPIKMIQRMVKLSTDKDSLLLDFFSGSSSTAHAVLDLNKEDGGNRKFILVQLPEPTGNANFPTIADIGKERIRRVINKIKNESESSLDFGDNKPDLGFKVFKLNKSNFRVWNGDVSGGEKEIAEQLESHIDHIDPCSSQEDILFEILLKAGFPLTTKIEKKAMAGKEVFSVDDGSLLICLEDDITKELIREMADMKPPMVVCLDMGFRYNDQLKTNAVQIMKSKEIEFRTV